MARPIQIRRGSVTVKIYASKFRGKKRYQWAFTVGGKRYRYNRTSKKTATLLAGEHATMLQNCDSAKLRLSNEECYKAELNKEKLKPYGATTEEAVDFFIAHKKAEGKLKTEQSILLRDLVPKYLDAKRAQGVGDYYLRNLESYLNRAAKDLKLPFAHNSSMSFRIWLDGLNVGPVTWNSNRGALAALVDWGRENGLLPPDWDPFKSLSRRPTETADPDLLTPSQLSNLLHKAPENLQICMAISAFAGLRTEEVQKLRWEDFHWDAGELHLRREIVKGRPGRRKKRSIPICEALRDWLSSWEHSSGPVSAYKSAKNQSDARRRLYNSIRPKGRNRNILRKSWISYRLAQCKDIGEVATTAGNSPSQIQEYYFNLVTEKSAEEWFAVRRTDVAQGILKLRFG
jgi:integrase